MSGPSRCIWPMLLALGTTMPVGAHTTIDRLVPEPVDVSVTIPSDDAHELCFLLPAGGVLEVGFASDSPIEFNLHHHVDGIVRYPVFPSSTDGDTLAFAAPTDDTYCLMWVNRSVDAITLDYRYRSALPD